ncbi:hypothetical protein GCM10007938_25060 [Vibrio zhanjiangensis]|uniref:Uncharacterized protein n=1 Tax=Vibrio zhanjiangensis TaxID=1046128 RepID=A0ABQ6F1R6_9VIBR|nr:hypothetical protein GCM10007938_25060 [Vibrio zhanjiangensis]
MDFSPLSPPFIVYVKNEIKISLLSQARIGLKLANQILSHCILDDFLSYGSIETKTPTKNTEMITIVIII